MDESIFGWGKEDIEFGERVKRLKMDIQELDFKGIHLWHPIKNTDLFLDIYIGCPKPGASYAKGCVFQPGST